MKLMTESNCIHFMLLITQMTAGPFMMERRGAQVSSALNSKQNHISLLLLL